MLKKLHGLLVGNDFTRKYQHQLTRKIKDAVSSPDAYGDLSKLIRTHRPDAFLDIGCHLGKTIERILDDNSLPIHGFEPTQSTFTRVQGRFSSDSRVKIHNIALSDSTGTAKFFCNSNEQTNSLLDNDEGNQSAWGQQTSHVDSQEVQTMRLDEWYAQEKPGNRLIIKSDIQGAEGMLVRGGETSLRDHVIAIFSEAQIGNMYEGQTDFFGLHEMLSGLGFSLHNVYPCAHDSSGKAVQTDAMWINFDLIGTTPSA